MTNSNEHPDAAQNAEAIAAFRANGNPRMILLTTVGAKSGQLRTNPLLFFRDGERIIVAASNHGYDSHPGWYYNLLAQPAVTVECGPDTFEATATVTSGDDRARLLELSRGPFSFLEKYQAGTEREIQLVALERA
ncbi:MAG: nitroreductase family deazaflavin-dependent oxidoreductase [Chloroflexi bacterium]|nr:MAG: nitroreductase family deazaflavin-dependent oxidoreductase [Chloroflexota bacterium]